MSTENHSPIFSWPKYDLRKLVEKITPESVTLKTEAGELVELR